MACIWENSNKWLNIYAIVFRPKKYEKSLNYLEIAQKNWGFSVFDVYLKEQT